MLLEKHFVNNRGQYQGAREKTACLLIRL